MTTAPAVVVTSWVGTQPARYATPAGAETWGPTLLGYAYGTLVVQLVPGVEVSPVALSMVAD
jgi:hypothetical protein